MAAIEGRDPGGRRAPPVRWSNKHSPPKRPLAIQGSGQSRHEIDHRLESTRTLRQVRQNEKLTSSYQNCVVNTLNWYLKEASKTDLVWSNEQYYLLGLASTAGSAPTFRLIRASRATIIAVRAMRLHRCCSGEFTRLRPLRQQCVEPWPSACGTQTSRGQFFRHVA